MKLLTYKDTGDKLENRPYIVSTVTPGMAKIERFRFEKDRDERADELREEHADRLEDV